MICYVCLFVCDVLFFRCWWQWWVFKLTWTEKHSYGKYKIVVIWDVLCMLLCFRCTCWQRRRRIKKRNIVEKVIGTCKQGKCNTCVCLICNMRALLCFRFHMQKLNRISTAETQFITSKVSFNSLIWVVQCVLYFISDSSHWFTHGRRFPPLWLNSTEAR